MREQEDVQAEAIEASEFEKLLKKAARMYDDDTVSKLSSPFRFPGSPKADSKKAQSSSAVKLQSKAQKKGHEPTTFASSASVAASSASSSCSSSASFSSSSPSPSSS